MIGKGACSFQAGDYSITDKPMKLVLSGIEGDEYEAEVYPRTSLLSKVFKRF